MTEIDNVPAHTIDPVAGEVARDRGIANAETGSGPEWQEQALALIRRIAGERSFLVSDDLWVSGLAEPKDGRALGATFIRAKNLGYIAPTMQFVITHQVSRHKAPIRVWRSKLRIGGDFQESKLLSRKITTAHAASTVREVGDGGDSGS